MTFPILLASRLALPSQPTDPELAVRIQQLFHTILVADDVKQEAAEAEARQIFLKRGLPTIAQVGDEAASEFVVLACAAGPADFQAKILLKAKLAVSGHALAPDAVLYCKTRVRQEQVKARVKRHPPTHPALRDEIQRLLTTDQAVRQRKDFDASKMEQMDREPVRRDLVARGHLEPDHERPGLPGVSRHDGHPRSLMSFLQSGRCTTMDHERHRKEGRCFSPGRCASS